MLNFCSVLGIFPIFVFTFSDVKRLSYFVFLCHLFTYFIILMKINLDYKLEKQIANLLDIRYESSGSSGYNNTNTILSGLTV